MTDEHPFSPFRLDPGVCDECGDLYESHAVRPPARTPEATQRMKSLWRTLIKVGGPYNYYGGGMSQCFCDGHKTCLCETHEMRTHMEGCNFDWRAMSEPAMDDRSAFAGTFATGDRYVSILGGYLYCVCEKYSCVLIVSPHDMTLGQLIWHAVREGEEL